MESVLKPRNRVHCAPTAAVGNLANFGGGTRIDCGFHNVNPQCGLNPLDSLAHALIV